MRQLGVRIVFIILESENNLKSLFYEIYSNIKCFFQNIGQNAQYSVY